MTQSWKLWVPTFFFPNFGVNTCPPPNFGIKMILFQNFYLPVHHVATIYSEIYAWPLIFSVRILYNTPTVSFPIHSPICFPLLLRTSLNNQSRHHQSSNPSSFLYSARAACQVIPLQPFLRFSSVPTKMTTSDYIPEVRLQISTPQLSAATLYFLFLKFISSGFLGNGK